MASGLAMAASILVPQAHAADSGGFFLISCDYSHSLMDDPIVYPGQPGASHMHDFFGNENTNAYSTPRKLIGKPTTCTDSLDSSGYWMPQAMLNGVPVTPIDASIYWLTNATGPVVAPPAGVTFIGGDKNATQDQAIKVVHYNCGSNQDYLSPSSSKPYDCTPYMSMGSDGVLVTVNFPDCWDGRLGKGDDSSHFSYRGNPHNSCPPDHSIEMAKISLRVHTGIVNPINPDGSIALSFSNGPYYQIHADFMNGWDQTELEGLVDTCLSAHAQCKLISK
jgi:hypothetical protein